jgi:hypothetical protein
MQGIYQNVIASLRDFYGTFTTSLAPSVILSSVKASDTVSSTLVMGGVPRGPTVYLANHRSVDPQRVRHT